MEVTGEAKLIPGNRLGMRLAEALRSMRGALDARPPGWVGRAGNVLPPGDLPESERLKLGTALMGQSPEEAEKIAQGDYPMRVPEMSNIPQFKTGRKQSTADLLLTGADLLPVANVAHKAAGRAVSKGLEAGAKRMEGTAARKAIGDVQNAVTGGSTPGVNVIKPRGGDWAPGAIDFMVDALRKKVKPTGDPAADAAVDKWMSTAMRKYFANDMGTPEDPVRLVHGQRKENRYGPQRGILGYDDYRRNYTLRNWGAEATPERDLEIGTAINNRDLANDLYAEEPFYARAVENNGSGGSVHESMADANIAAFPAEDIVSTLQQVGEEVPEWLTKKPPRSIMYDVDQYSGPNTSQNLAESFDRAGLPRLVEILQEELRSGGMRPESVNKVSVESLAKKRLSQVENEAANISKKYSKELPAYQGLEYPDGSKWVEIPADAKQLEAEGDLMGHCVGGYCEMVEKGEKRIISLRDAKGMPDITIDSKGNMYRTPGAIAEGGVGEINQVMAQGNRFPEGYMDKVKDFLRRARPDDFNITHSPMQAPNPNDVMRQHGLEVPEFDPYGDDYGSANALFGVIDRDRLKNVYDPFGEQNLNEILKDANITRKQGKYDAENVGNILRERGISPQQVAVQRDVASDAHYSMERIDPNFVMNFDEFFKFVNRGTKNPEQFVEDVSALASDKRWMPISEQNEYIDRINENAGKQLFERLVESPNAAFNRTLPRRYIQLEDAFGVRFIDSAVTEPHHVDYVDAVLEEIQRAADKGLENTIDIYLDLLRKNGYIE